LIVPDQRDLLEGLSALASFPHFEALLSAVHLDPFFEKQFRLICSLVVEDSLRIFCLTLSLQSHASDLGQCLSEPKFAIGLLRLLSE
jgi:hypothetical protein